MKKLTYILSLIFPLLFGCSNDQEKINKAKATVTNFFNIVKTEDESKMKEAYDSLSKFQTYYKTDSGTIKDVIIKKIAQSLCIFLGVFKKASLSTTNPENEENIFFPNVANEAIKA